MGPGDSGTPFWRKDDRSISSSSHLYSCSGWRGVLWPAERAHPGWWHSPLAGCNANTRMTSGSLRRQPLPLLCPATVPGSFSHLGTLPRSLLTGGAIPVLGSGSPTASASAVGSNSRGAGSGAGIGGGVPAALDMHLRTEGRGPGWLTHSGRGSPSPLPALTWPPAHQLQMGGPYVPAAEAPGRGL